MAVYDDVVIRLAMLGYEVTDVDKPAVQYQISRAERYIKNNTNLPEVPEGLFGVWVDMAAGLFLYDCKAAGKLGEGFEFSAPAKSISEGDTSVTFAGASDGAVTPEARFDALLARMINPPQDELAAYRRMKW